MQELNTVAEYGSTRLLDETVSVESSDLERLRLRYSELSQDVARLHQLLDDLAQCVLSPRMQSGARAKRASRMLDGRLDYRHASPLRAPRRMARQGASLSPAPSNLKRACLIALMEADEPVSVETIYDRIARRGSFTFAGYKHPLRAIGLAMGAMVRQGQALLHNEGGLRRWRWDPILSSEYRSPSSLS
jgi:hypothetical protein